MALHKYVYVYYYYYYYYYYYIVALHVLDIHCEKQILYKTLSVLVLETPSDSQGTLALYKSFTNLLTLLTTTYLLSLLETT